MAEMMRWVTEYATEVTWVDHEKAGARGPTSIYGWVEDVGTLDGLQETYRRDRAVAAIRTLVRQASYTEPVAGELERITPKVREAALDRLFRNA